MPKQTDAVVSPPHKLASCYRAAREAFKDAWIGINTLQLRTAPLDVWAWAASNTPGLNGVQLDAAMTPLSGSGASPSLWERCVEERKKHGMERCLYLGGVGGRHCVDAAA